LTATGYELASVVAGLLAAAAGVVVGAAHARWTLAGLPVDPDVDRMRKQQ
jgi:hypothetical protein